MEKQKAAWSLSGSQESSKLLRLLPLPSQNFVHLGETKYMENSRFSFTVWFNILSQDYASILTGFRADYIAPDGCYCANQDFEIQVGGKSISTSNNDLNFTEPIPIAAGTMIQLAYRRFFFHLC